MKVLEKIMKAEKKHETILTIILAAYILFDVPMPSMLSSVVDTLVGKIILIVLSLTMLVSTNPILGVISLIAAYELVRRSNGHRSSDGMLHYMQSELAKKNDFSRFNNFPNTLEEDCVKKMPETKSQYVVPSAEYSPVQADDGQAAPLDYNGVI